MFKKNVRLHCGFTFFFQSAQYLRRIISSCVLGVWNGIRLLEYLTILTRRLKTQNYCLCSRFFIWFLPVLGITLQERGQCFQEGKENQKDVTYVYKACSVRKSEKS